MKLSARGKNNLLESANNVYLAYTALDFFKTKTFTMPDEQRSLYDVCKNALADKNYDQTILINNINYRLILTPGSNNTYKVQFARSLESPVHSVVKKIADYETQEVLNLLVNQEFTLEIPIPVAEPSVSNRINKDCIIGGIGKVDLYRTHLVTLYNIIKKIDSEEDISNLLVALATGSGKTFVQALWMLILSLSNNNGIFAVPDKLANQFAKDLKRLLPEEFVNNILILRDKGNNPQVEEAIKSLAHASGTGTIIVASTDRLLDQHYQDMMDADSQHTFLAFDEQHLIMKTERRRIRLIELSKKKLSMFLTATPNQETYDISGNKPVAIMSSGQKQDAGQGQFPKLYTHQARNITDRNTLKNYRFWTLEFWQNMLNGLLLRLMNSTQEEQSSAAVTLVEDLPFYYHRKEGEEHARWRMQVPAARKMLFIIDDNETLVNFCYALQHAPAHRRDVYRNGNVINRADVAHFFQLPDAEVEVIRKDMQDKRSDYKAALKDDEQAIGETLVNKTLAEQMKDTVFHNLIEYVLADITGLDEIEHNRLRKLNLEDFKQSVLTPFKLRTSEYYRKKLAKLIDVEGAQVIGELLADLSGVLHSIIQGSFDFDSSRNAKDLAQFIDNWSLNDELINKIKEKYPDFARKFDAYASKHLVMGIMTGMKDAETPVEESRPFSGLNHHNYCLYDGTGVQTSYAKKRKHTSLEILNDTSRESAFTPAYLNISEDTADNYFRLGFVGAYVSNKKTEGFSDRNLHTVISIAEEKLSATNSPETQIQGIGRNRGLDETIEPAYIHSSGRHQETVFDLDHLQSDDYYPELFKAQEQYNIEYVQVLGVQVSQKIMTWIYTNVDKDESINPDHLKRQVLRFIAQALRELNNKNSHQIKLSRAQLTDVVHYAMKDIDRELAHINKPYQVSIFIRILGFIINFISECYYSVKRIPAAIKIYAHSWSGRGTTEQSKLDAKKADDLYIKILGKTSYKKMISKMFSVIELRNWLTRKTDGAISRVKKNVENYIKKEVFADFKLHQQQFLEPLFIKMVIDSKKEQVSKSLAAFLQFPTLFHVNQSVLNNLFEKDASKFEAKLLTLLQQIPGLEDLVITDIVNYPKNMANIQEFLTKQPLHFLTINPELQNALSKQLADYLKGDFIKHLSAFVAYPNVKKIEQILNKENNAQLFVHHCLNKLIKEGLKFSPEAFFEELKSYFNIEEFNRLDEEIQKLQDEFKALQTETKEHLIESIDEYYVTSLISIIKNRVLPVLVNVFPLEHRKTLLKNASKDEKIRQLLIAHGTELSSLMENKKDQLPGFIFSKLTKAPLPAQLDIQKEVADTKAFFSKKLNEIMNKNVVSLFYGKVISPYSWHYWPKYMYDVPIAKFFQSDEFLNRISIMLPYDQWVQLKANILNNYSGLLTIARALIDKAAKGELEQLSPEELVTLFNEQFETQYEGSEQAIDRASASMKALNKQITDDPLDALNQNTKNKYTQLILRRLLPIFASFIKDDSKKAQFLAVRRDDEVLYDFITQNVEALKTFSEIDGDALNKKVFGFINQLLPKGSKLAFEDIIDPKINANATAKMMQNDLKSISLVTFLSSKAFSDLMSDFLNPQDLVLLKTYMGTFEHIKMLADKMSALEVDSLDKEAILKIIKSSDPSLNKIVTMDDRAQIFKDFLSTLTDVGTVLDKTRMSQLVTDLITPVLFHKQFITVVDELIGFLNEQELTLMLDAMHKNEPAVEVKQLLHFMHLIRTQNKEELMRQFMSLPDDIREFDIEKLPAKKFLATIKDLIEELLDCHCYYNGHDRRGEHSSSSTPKLLAKMSPELKNINVSSGDSNFAGYAQRIFYIDGINKGIDAGGKISSDSNKHITSHLQRVKSHILRPLWWSTNVSNFNHSVIKTCRDIAHGLIAGYYWTLNVMKSGLNWISRSDYFKISSKQVDSEDYNNTAFDFAQEVNALDPLNAEQVKEKECRIDVVKKLEEFVSKRPSRPGFFAGISNRPLTVSDEPDLDLNPRV